jgi:lipoprotein NlpI
MSRDQKKAAPQYTCNEYREEMILLALRRKLQRSDLTDDERAKLIQEIRHLEKTIGF